MEYSSAYSNNVLSYLHAIIHTYLSKHHPHLLLSRKQLKEKNGNEPNRIWDPINRKLIPNPKYLANTINLAFGQEICSNIADVVWSDDGLKTTLLTIACKDGEKKVESESDLVKMMCTRRPGGRETETHFVDFLKKVIRKSAGTSNKINHIYEAKKNERAGEGPFKGHNEETIKILKERITDLLRGSKDGHMTEKEATAIVVEMLEQHCMAYLWHLNVPQLTALVRDYVREENPHRAEVLEQEIVAWRAEQKSTSTLHDQELNEIVTHLDFIIKVKGSLVQIVPLLMKRGAIHLDLYDEDFEEHMRDIYVEVSLSLYADADCGLADYLAYRLTYS